MSCYLRHLTDLLAEAGIELTKETRKVVDLAVHQAVGVAYKHCPIAWKEVKARLPDPSARKALAQEIRKALAN